MGKSHLTSDIEGVTGNEEITNVKKVQTQNVDCIKIKTLTASCQRLVASAVQLDITYQGTLSEGQVKWNPDIGVVEYGLPGGDRKHKIGEEHFLLVRNKSGETIAKGLVIYISGAQGNKPLISKASASSNPVVGLTFGLTTEEIRNNQNGYVTTQGLVRDIDTNGYPVGAPLFLSATPGEFTSSQPKKPRFNSLVGYCLRKHVSEGIILARSELVPWTRSLGDVKKESPTIDGQFLRWNAASGIYKVGKTASYLNHSATQGRLGWGLRAKNGIMEYKNLNGTWAAIT